MVGNRGNRGHVVQEGGGRSEWGSGRGYWGGGGTGGYGLPDGLNRCEGTRLSEVSYLPPPPLTWASPPPCPPPPPPPPLHPVPHQHHQSHHWLLGSGYRLISAGRPQQLLAIASSLTPTHPMSPPPTPTHPMSPHTQPEGWIPPLEFNGAWRPLTQPQCSY